MSSKNRNKKKERNYSTNERNFSSGDSKCSCFFLCGLYKLSLCMNPMNSIILNKDNAEDKEVIKYF
jgi:hypothetical protein